MVEQVDIQEAKRIRLDHEANRASQVEVPMSNNEASQVEVPISNTEASQDEVSVSNTETSQDEVPVLNTEVEQDEAPITNNETNQDENSVTNMEMGQDTSLPANDQAEKEAAYQATKEANKIAILKTNNEESVGVTEFASTIPGFMGLVKKRFSDFTVREITLDGAILNCQRKRRVLVEQPAETTEEPGAGEADLSKAEPASVSVKAADVGFEPSEEFYREIQNKFSLEDDHPILTQLKEMISSKGKTHSEGVLMPVVITDKVLRTSIHQYVKEAAMNKLETTTVDGKIQFKFAKKGARNTRRPRDEPNSQAFTHFTLYKENRDTMAVVNMLAGLMRENNKSFGFAGTKDKRGVTLQRVSAHRVPIKRLAGLNKGLRGIYLSDFTTSTEPIRLGDLKGNHFTVVIRNIKGPLRTAVNAVECFKQNGLFINYFGMQRFGTSAVPTHAIGLELLKSNWKAAVALILDPRPGDDHEVNTARRFWAQTQDPAASYIKFPHFLVAERAILASLSKDPHNFLEAIKRIPRTLRLMYVHAYQSYVWNKAVSARVAAFGLKPIPGDLLSPTQVVTRDNHYSLKIHDVVLPLPGVDVTYPSYPAPLETLYQDIMAKDGLDPTSMSRAEKDFSLSGDYRKVAVKVDTFSWEVLHYTKPDADLITTDIGSHVSATNDKGRHEALKLEFSLPPSTYATMLLREIMKTRTEKASMASHN